MYLLKISKIAPFKIFRAFLRSLKAHKPHPHNNNRRDSTVRSEDAVSKHKVLRSQALNQFLHKMQNTKRIWKCNIHSGSQASSQMHRIWKVALARLVQVTWVGVHNRRGDYAHHLNLLYNLPLLGPDFFLSAMKYFTRRNTEPVSKTVLWSVCLQLFPLKWSKPSIYVDELL